MNKLRSICAFLAVLLLLNITIFACTHQSSTTRTHTASGGITTNCTCVTGTTSNFAHDIDVASPDELDQCFHKTGLTYSNGTYSLPSNAVTSTTAFLNSILANPSNLSCDNYLYGEHADDIGTHEGIDSQNLGDTDTEVNSPVDGKIVDIVGSIGAICIYNDYLQDTIVLMHMVLVTTLGEGDYITRGTELGHISNVGTNNVHLHVQVNDQDLSEAGTEIGSGKNDTLVAKMPYSTFSMLACNHSFANSYCTTACSTCGYQRYGSHNPSTPTNCTSTCTRCGQQSYSSHNYSTIFSIDGYATTHHHWRACTHPNCTATYLYAQHTPSGLEYYYNNSYHTQLCSVCDYDIQVSHTPSLGAGFCTYLNDSVHNVECGPCDHNYTTMTHYPASYSYSPTDKHYKNCYYCSTNYGLVDCTYAYYGTWNSSYHTETCIYCQHPRYIYHNGNACGTCSYPGESSSEPTSSTSSGK